MNDSFADKVVLVTGATSGIGHAVAVKFAEASARVVALGRDQAALREVESAVKNAGGEPLTMTVDVTNSEQGQRAIELCGHRRRARNLHVCASQTLFRPRRGVHVLLSFLCNTRGTEGKHNEETYCEAPEGSHGELLMYGNLEACSLREALIVSNPRVAKYPCHHRTI